MDGIIIFGLLLLGGVLISRSSKAIAGMDDPKVTIDNIRRGAKEGWYEVALTRVDNKPAVKLTGTVSTGERKTFVYPISQEDFDQLQLEGFLIELYDDRVRQ